MSSHISSQRALSVRIPERLVEKAVAAITSHYWREYKQEHAPDLVLAALTQWIDQHVDLVLEEVTELLTKPGSDEALEFGRMLARTELPASDVVPETVQTADEELHPIFSGNRAFSADRLAAMMGHFASKGIELYKTKLNKLLFYADMTAFYLTGRGLSGAQYVNLPFGPVPDRFEEMIDHAAKAGMIQTVTDSPRNPSARVIESGTIASDLLSEEDRRILDWVSTSYGNLSTAAITGLSHEERAYRDTRPGERIAYAYAQFLKTLPPKDLLDS